MFSQRFVVCLFLWVSKKQSDVSDGRIKPSVLAPAEFSLGHLHKVVKP